MEALTRTLCGHVLGLIWTNKTLRFGITTPDIIPVHKLLRTDLGASKPCYLMGEIRVCTRQDTTRT